MKDKLIETLVKMLETAIGDSEQPNKQEAEVAVVKSLNEMQKRAMFIVLEPQNDDGTTADLHGDWYDAESIHEAMVSFNIQCRKAGLEHQGILSNEDVVIEESYVAPCDFTVEETGAFVKKGSWIQTWKFLNDDLWADVLSGHFTGVSIECSALASEIE